MANKETVYSKVEEADAIIKALCEKHSDVLWRVVPDQVVVLGIENKKRGKKNKKLAKIKPVKGVEKVILQFNNVPTRRIIELYWADWNEWGPRLRKAILFHELLHIGDEDGKVVKHDCEDFRIMIDKLGVDWVNNPEKLPDLTNDEIVFDPKLMPGLDELLEEGESEDA